MKQDAQGHGVERWDMGGGDAQTFCRIRHLLDARDKQLSSCQMLSKMDGYVVSTADIAIFCKSERHSLPADSQMLR